MSHAELMEILTGHPVDSSPKVPTEPVSEALKRQNIEGGMKLLAMAERMAGDPILDDDPRAPELRELIKRDLELGREMLCKLDEERERMKALGKGTK